MLLRYCQRDCLNKMGPHTNRLGTRSKRGNIQLLPPASSPHERLAVSVAVVTLSFIRHFSDILQVLF